MLMSIKLSLPFYDTENIKKIFKLNIYSAEADCKMLINA